MRPFNLIVWQERARRRFEKSTLDKKIAKEKYTEDLKAIDSLNIVMEWCSARALKVNFGNTNEYCPVSKTITISSRTLPENQLFLAFHEIGHYLVDVLGSSRSRTSKGYTTNLKDKSLHFKVDTIDEEYDAWARGRNLADRLEINIDDKRFSRYKVKSIKTYFEWALDKKDSFEEDK